MNAAQGPLAPGAQVEEFQVVRALGRGGFGITYLARDRALHRPVALKEYLPHQWAARRADGTVVPRSSALEEAYAWGRDRFLGEARVLAKLDHPRVVRVHRVIEAAGTAYIVMEYVKGRSLAEKLSESGPLPEPAARPLLTALAEGLAAVHAEGLLHRDVKPENVMLRSDDTPVLIDFGAARQHVGRRSRTLVAMYSPGYTPLEQYSSTGRQGTWTDIYALGAVAYEAVTGRVPEEAPARVERDPLEPVESAAVHPVSAGLAKAVNTALAVAPRARPQDVRQWLALLGRDSHGSRRPPDGGSAPVGRKPVHQRATLILGRDRACDVVLQDASVSRRHARITRLRSGLHVADLGSTNGTFRLEGGRWEPVEQVLVEASDQLLLGRHQISATELDALCAAGYGPRWTQDGGQLDPEAAKMRNPSTGEVMDKNASRGAPDRKK